MTWPGDLIGALRAIRARPIDARRAAGNAAELTFLARVAADPQRLGSPCRQPGCQSGRYAVHQERSARLARTIIRER
jgi:hypothetical protein